MGRNCPYLHKRGRVYYFFWRDSSGQRFEESLRTIDVETAKQRYRDRMSEIESGVSPNNLADRTLKQACSEWLTQRQLEISNGSFLSERSIVRNLLAVLGADSRIRSLADPSKLRLYQQERLKAGVSAKTINNEIQVLRGMLETAQVWQRVEHKYKRLHVKKSDVPDALTQEESLRVLRAAAGASSTAVAPWAAVLAFSTGMRSGEIKRLRLADLHEDDELPYLVVRRQTTKTDAGARRVALGRIALTALTKLRFRSELMGSIEPTDYLLPTDRARHTRGSDPLHGGSGFDPSHHQSSWEWEWKRFRETADISHRRFHDLRHTYVTRAAEAGVPNAVIEAQVGHMNREMVRWYTHVSTRAQHKAACQIEALSPDLLVAISDKEGKESAVQKESTLVQPGIKQVDATKDLGVTNPLQNRSSQRGCRGWRPTRRLEPSGVQPPGSSAKRAHWW